MTEFLPLVGSQGDQSVREPKLFCISQADMMRTAVVSVTTGGHLADQPAVPAILIMMYSCGFLAPVLDTDPRLAIARRGHGVAVRTSAPHVV
jgi:hypothetical protein